VRVMEASIQNEGTTSGSAATDACAPCIAPDTDGTTTDTFADGGEAAGGGEALFRKPKRNKNVRRAAATASAGALEEGADDSTSLVKPSKITKPNPLVQSTVSEKKRVLLQKELAEASDRRIASFDNKVFATNEQDTERDRDAQAQYELAQQQWADGGDVAADGSKIYRGQKAYHQYTNKAEDFTSTMLKGHGPARAPVHYRATSRFDYQPDVCKDFKDTGYCGYGDACKFLHDRSDYKTGWQIERDWDEAQRAKKHQEALIALGELDDAPKKEDDNLPFACLICREPWHKASRPVVTKCEHYFCEACALRHFQKSRRCFTCGEQTGGIFNLAKNIQEKIRMRTEEAEASAADEDLSQEALIAEYEAAKRKSENRGSTSGWTFS